MRRALVWLNLYGREAVRHKLKNRQKTSFLFLGCLWAYVGQPHDHIGWATPMPFASINSTNQRTNPWNFREIILRIGRAGKWDFFYLYFFSNENNLGFHMRYHFFCTMNSFFRILENTLSKLVYDRNWKLAVTLGRYRDLPKP